MTGRCDDKVVIITGAGRGLGRAHALAFARQGAKVVVNDSGVDTDGTGGSTEPADSVVAAIAADGGEAVACYDDVADWDGAGRVVDLALERFGRVDVLVNNAGILRDRMLVNMTIEEWDDVIRTHLRGTFAPTRRAVDHWRARSKAGESVDARVVNVSSPSGLYGNIGQANYGAAKAGIAAFTLIAAQELARIGVALNAIAPGARTRMTENLGVLDALSGDGEFDSMAPENVSPLVVWLATEEAKGVTGRVFNIWGGSVSVADGWVAGPGEHRDSAFDLDVLNDVMPRLLAEAAPNADMLGRRGATD